MRPTHRQDYRTGTEMCVTNLWWQFLVFTVGQAFPWCALFINMENLSVSTDYTRYHDTCKLTPYAVEDVLSQITTSYCGFSHHRPRASRRLCLLAQDVAVCLTARLFQSSSLTCSYFRLGRAKSHIIFCDSDLNTLPVVYLNAYQNLLVVAMRMHHYLRSWGANIRKNVKFIHSMLYTGLPLLFLDN
jgi:telomerase reverse transcriptase